METFDYETQFERVKKDVVAALTKALDVQAHNTGLRLQARDVSVDDQASSSDWESQKEAVRKDRTWGVPVYATVDLTDRKTGKLLSTAKRVKIATLPKPTDFGSFIIDGKHYQVENQLRRKPGVYVTERESGEVETEINIAGRPFNIKYNPKDPKGGVFELELKQGGGNKTTAKLYPVLSRLGISDGVLAKTWGENVLARNKALSSKKSDEAVKKVAEFFRTGNEFSSTDDATKAIASYLDEETELRPEVTERTLGKAFSKVTPETIVLGSKELLRTLAGERGTDDRHALEYKKAFALSDIMRERFFKANGELSPYLTDFRKKIERKLNNQRNPPTQVSQLVGPSQFNAALTSFFAKSDLSSTTEQINPIHMLNGMNKITIMGEGGITDEQRVRDEEHMLHPSHLGFLDPVHTPDSGKIGLVMNLPVGVSKRGDELETAVWDARTKKNRRITPSEAASLTISFADQFENDKPIDRKVKALVNGEAQMVDASKVDVVLKSSRQAFSIASNTLPFQPALAGVRAQMATKMLEQAIPVVHREAPLVQVKLGNDTIENAIGSGFSIKSHEDGVVKSLTKNKIVISTKDGEVEHTLFSNLPLNKSFVNAAPLDTLKVGDLVKKGEVIADSNFTKGGTLAIGTNLRAAYMPWKGYNFEDGIVITEEAARKLTSEHMYQHSIEPTGNTVLDLHKFLAVNKGGLDLDQQAKMDPDGVIKKGAILHKGDPLWVGTQPYKLTDPDAVIMRRFGGRPENKPVIEQWTNDHEGEVVDVVRMGKKVKVYVKTKEPAQIGDKLTNRSAAKGIITKIIPVGEAPKDANGDAVDIILNPHGIVGRINPSQILETAAAKLAQKTGKPYIVDNSAPGVSMSQTLWDQTRAAGIDDEEELFDPATNASLGKVLTGPQYVLKLSKQATSQFSARAPGGKYDAHGNPTEGGEEGGKALDMLSFYSMLSHGARANLQEMSTFKGTKNDQFWQWLSGGAKTGQLPPQPSPTMSYKKFEAYLKGAGVNVKRSGSRMILQPLTDRETTNLSSGAVQDPLFLKAKDLSEEKGGLMDPLIFGPGGRAGTQWGHIDLAEPIPNPVFEKPIKTLTGLKPAQYDGFVNGELWYDPNSGEIGAGELEKHPDTLTGGAAIHSMLSKIDIDKDLLEWTDKAKKATTSAKLDQANKRIKYLAALKKLKIRPEEAYVQTKIPVIPPAFRPVVENENGSLTSSGLNTLYRDLALVNNELKWQNDQHFIPDSISAETRRNLYEGVKAVAGLGDPIANYPGEREPKGFIKQIKGGKAKEGFYQYSVLRRRQEPVGRGTIIPEPKLGLDEVGLPEEMSWKIFEPFIMRRLVGHSGLDPIEAEKQVEGRTPLARSALEAEMQERPVLLNRAPSLHKFSIMAFKPQITEGRAIKIPPLVVKGFGADYDGDTMTVHVPVLGDAVTEAQKMVPSKHLYNPGTGAVMIAPQNEAALGLYQMSNDPTLRGEIIEKLPTTLKEKYKDRVLDKDGLNDLMRDIAKASPDGYGAIVANLKGLGDNHTTRTGFTVGLKDLLPSLPERDAIFAQTRKDLAGFDTGTAHGRKQSEDTIRKANDDLKDVLNKRLPEQGNNFHLMVRSGARGNIDQLKQIVSAPFMIDNHHGQPQMVPVMRSFAEGLPLSDYWSTLYGARSAAVDKQLQTAEPGAFNKDIMATTITNVVSTNDCHTTDGIKIPISGRGMTVSPGELSERFLSSDIRVGGTVIAHAGDQISSQLIDTLRDRGVDEMKVRSPLTCRAPKGTCAKCYGIDEHGQLPTIGTNIGAIAGQSVSEPLTQMTLRTFHSGGVSGTRGAISGYAKIDKLFKMEEIKHGKAALAPADGKISKIEEVQTAAGSLGRNVFIGDRKEPVFVDHSNWDEKRGLRVGSEVQKGQILSAGLVQPQDLLELRGMLGAQDYIAGEIHKEFNLQKVPIKRKIVETIIRSVGNTTKIGKDTGDSAYIPGDIAPWTEVEHYNKTKIGDIPVEDSLGHTLLEDLPGMEHGKPITDRVKSLLQQLGKQKVSVGPKPIEHEPFLSGVKQVPFLRKDWMSQMGYQRLTEAILNGAAEGHESDIHGYAPVPAFAFGAEFGDAPGGRSKTEGVY